MIRKFIYILFNYHLMIFGNAYIPHGKWCIENKNTPYFLVDQRSIKTVSENSLIALKTDPWVYDPINDSIYFDLKDIQVIKKPDDWYNLKKYVKYLEIYNNIRSQGIRITIKIKNDEAHIGYTFKKNEYKLLLKKIE